ncbi:hypothetical protein C8Q69DRAFT_62725 [Paecilomyces variotii]|uniref:Developmental regulatory protein wetA n=1 Tax=Byssochlamys spectabilis TaxID=264951 RepID=A0A443HN09_BYSSP|nr:hypothetical protein C8Q69DRAFT_62725 [Paecilomyces variotii]KAJ9258194.1 hypothetical protein DTO212C5_8768 [Paecilomyces variotii]KAJ9309076.1 hypothetical protein DTO217A2_1445 [Paecilomyces variotii]KAJ9363319.1 hypothetical protein DTO280E4_2727 [Paecilomyces variotii]KAJ9387543.1 hypothetical protein DTO063F5_3107 [Paecilomyces variotii]RWQ93202.1 hypothetical protein C8Q69DRAFT_62725 [Paecilomyces variotii]
MFAPSFDQSFNDIFNEYVNMDSTGDGNKEVPFTSSDIEQLFPSASFSSDCGDLSPIGSSSRQPPLSPQPWSKGLWCMQDDGLSSVDQRTFSFHDTIHPSAISDLSLNLESSSRPAEAPGLISTSPSTPPATPSRKPSKSAIITPKTIRRRETNDRRALLRKHSFSPSLMRSSHMQKTKMAYPEAWAQRLQNYHFRNSDERLPLSPPPSDILVQHETMQPDNHAQMHMSSSAPSGGLMRDSAEMPTNYDSNMFHQASAMSIPQRQRYLSHHGSIAMSASSTPSADEIFHSPHSSEPQPMPSWHADALNTPSMPFTPDLQSHDPQAWWSPMASRVAPATQGQAQNPYLVSPLPHRPTQNTNHSDLLQGGLMINFDPSFDMSAPESSFSSSTLQSAGQDRSYAHVPGPQQPFAKNSPFTTPRGVHATQSSPRSPSVSPTTSPKSGAAARTGTNMKAGHRRNHSRKLSSQSASAPKPVKAGSPNGANKTVSVSFVNFTPNDSRKILTGVAPSGSSKTKARREQEARDKRRKLSEAALMAVKRAGGDVEALEAVLC